MKVGTKVKIIKLPPYYSGQRVDDIGTVIRDDGDWCGEQSYLVSFGENVYGWYLEGELMEAK